MGYGHLSLGQIIKINHILYSLIIIIKILFSKKEKKNLRPSLAKHIIHYENKAKLLI